MINNIENLTHDDFLNLKLKDYNSQLDGIVINEICDINILDKIIHSKLLKKKKSNPLSPFATEKKLLEHYKELYKNDYFQVVLKKVDNCIYGRCNPTKALSLFSIRREIRHSLCKNLYVDFDIVNCHPTILYQICKYNSNNYDLKYSNLEKCVNNRDYYINLVMTTHKVDYKNAKLLFIIIMYGGSYDKWCDELNILDRIPFIYDLIEDIDNISKIIVKNNPKLVNKIHELKECQSKINYNIYSSVMSYFLQEIEVRILELVFNYCIEKRYIINNECVLTADGIMLLKKYIDKFNTNDICNEFNKVVLEKTGLNLKYVIKDFDQDFLNILDNNMIFELHKQSFNTGNISIYFKMIYGSNYLYKDSKLYFYNGIIWQEDDKTMSNLHNFIDGEFYNHLNNNFKKLMKETVNEDDNNDNNDSDDNNLNIEIQHKEKLELFYKNIQKLKKNSFRRELVADICHKICNNNIKFDNNPSPSYYIKTTCGFNYENNYPKTYINKLDKLLDTIFPIKEVKDYYLSILSTGLSGIQIESLFIAKGSGGNGKSLINSLMMSLVGEYGYKVTSNLLLDSIKNGGDPQLALIHNKRFVLAQEPDNKKRICTATLKELTGDKKINSRKLFSNDCEINLKLTFVLECNDLPLLDQTIEALVRRIRVIDFISRFVDKNRYEEIADKTNLFIGDLYYKSDEFQLDYRQALFEILRCKFELFKNNNFNFVNIPKICLESTDNYLKDSDDIYDWFITMYEKNDNVNNEPIMIKSIYNTFQESMSYLNLSYQGKRKCTLKFFNEKIKSNIFLQNFYKKPDSTYNKIRYQQPFLIGYKLIEVLD